jgi:hypothetical protein
MELMPNFYKFKTNNPIVFQTLIKGREFKNDWIEIRPTGQIIISKDYAWDGCTPKFNFLDLTWGTPDGRMVDCTYQITWYASLIHDAIYQFKKTIPITRKEADQLFYIELLKQKFKLKYVYFGAVRLFGWVMGSWNY